MNVLELTAHLFGSAMFMARPGLSATLSMFAVFMTVPGSSTLPSTSVIFVVIPGFSAYIFLFYYCKSQQGSIMFIVLAILPVILLVTSSTPTPSKLILGLATFTEHQDLMLGIPDLNMGSYIITHIAKAI